eukprot:GHVQ01004827.1.p1 GENE.GHVQ01004827.1~~GHVQ01004827.1.p1  ORF type:complete len:823 (-),score=104.55 GHVQ01004827.1:359-2827(-)
MPQLTHSSTLCVVASAVSVALFLFLVPHPPLSSEEIRWGRSPPPWPASVWLFVMCAVAVPKGGAWGVRGARKELDCRRTNKQLQFAVITPISAHTQHSSSPSFVPCLPPSRSPHQRANAKNSPSDLSPDPANTTFPSPLPSSTSTASAFSHTPTNSPPPLSVPPHLPPRRLPRVRDPSESFSFRPRFTAKPDNLPSLYPPVVPPYLNVPPPLPSNNATSVSLPPAFGGEWSGGGQRHQTATLPEPKGAVGERKTAERGPAGAAGKASLASGSWRYPCPRPPGQFPDDLFDLGFIPEETRYKIYGLRHHMLEEKKCKSVLLHNLFELACADPRVLRERLEMLQCPGVLDLTQREVMTVMERETALIVYPERFVATAKFLLAPSWDIDRDVIRYIHRYPKKQGTLHKFKWTKTYPKNTIEPVKLCATNIDFLQTTSTTNSTNTDCTVSISRTAGNATYVDDNETPSPVPNYADTTLNDHPDEQLLSFNSTPWVSPPWGTPRINDSAQREVGAAVKEGGSEVEESDEDISGGDAGGSLYGEGEGGDLSELNRAQYDAETGQWTMAPTTPHREGLIPLPRIPVLLNTNSTARWTVEEVRALLLSHPGIARKGPVTLSRRFTLLQNECGFYPQFIVNVCRRQPYLLEVGRPDLRWRYLWKMGWFTKPQAYQLARKWPQLLALNMESNVRAKMLYLMDYMDKSPSEVLDFPDYLSYNLRKRIMPRHMVFVIKHRHALKRYHDSLAFHDLDEDVLNYLKQTDNLGYHGAKPIPSELLLSPPSERVVLPSLSEMLIPPDFWFMQKFNASRVDWIAANMQVDKMPNIHSPI